MINRRVALTALLAFGALAAVIGAWLNPGNRQADANATGTATYARPQLKKGEVPQLQTPADLPDFVDLLFGVGQVMPQVGGAVLISLRATFDQQEVGFSRKVPIEVPAGLLTGKSDLSVRLAPDRIEILSDGELSDRFVTALQKLYKTGNRPLKMAPRISVSAVNLADNDQILNRDLIQLKLFFNDHSTNSDEYAECFLNLDLPHNYVEVAEKDSDYRKPLIKALTVP